ncbi:MAG: hypothetical protein IIY81_00530 [Lachnospiraceae bacterium]|jgi:uncharacterized protein involved in cysteine biosynthesis|nr:hypothetical protein [Lachnospiraceae bacterium]
MRRRREQVEALFFEGLKEVMKTMPTWVRILVPLLWLLLYVALILVVGYLAITYHNVLLGIFDIGFVSIVLSVFCAAIRYYKKNNIKGEM